MGCSSFFVFLCLSWSFSILSTHQLQSSQTQVLLQLRKHLEYPEQLKIWSDHRIDFCTIPPSSQVHITCENNFVTELKIMGDSKVSDGRFNGFPIQNQTLSITFSMDSFVTTLARLTSLTSLTLVSLGIWGPLPDKIYRLSSLQVLNLSSNYLYGEIPQKISRLVVLETLALDNNFFNDSISDWMNPLSKLSVLSLKNNEISGKTPDLSSLSSLYMLDLSGNRLDHELPSLPKGLIMAFLHNNSYSGEIPKQYTQLSNIQHLDLSFNLLEGTIPGSLFSLPNISSLNLASNRFTGSLSNQTSCGINLEFTDISNNKLKGDLPSCLSSASENKVFQYGGNCFSVDTKNQHSESYCLAAEQKKKEKSRGRNVGVLLSIIGVGFILTGLILCLLLVLCRKYCCGKVSEQHLLHKAGQENSATGFTSELLTNARFISEAAKSGTQIVPICRSFSLEELKEATMNFDDSKFLGEGSYGKLYKGRLDNGTQIAIRCLPLSKKFSIRNLKLRLDLLAKLRHPHLVCLLGHCIDDSVVNKVFLVYEYIQNGNFPTHLSEKGLEWSERLAVLIGVAKAVHFLHTGVISSFSNNRLKTHNILLTEHRMAKLSDYGLSIVSEDIENQGTKGEDHKSWQTANSEDDIYNFGFIILESLAGPSVAARRDAYLQNELASLSSQEGQRRLLDQTLLATCLPDSLSVVISIMNKCVSSDLSVRPSFEDILWNLQYAAQVQATANGNQRF